MTDATAPFCGVCRYYHPASLEGLDEDIAYRVRLIHEEAAAWQRLHAAIADVVEAVESYPYLWNIGDGCGGAVIDDLYKAFHAAGFETERHYTPRVKSKKQLPAKLRAIVLARDGLRCKHCGCDDIDEIGVDHIIAVANGGTDDLGNLQTLCRSCNSKKGTK